MSPGQDLVLSSSTSSVGAAQGSGLLLRNPIRIAFLAQPILTTHRVTGRECITASYMRRDENCELDYYY